MNREEVYLCQGCRDFHETWLEAEQCCPPELWWRCGVCKKTYAYDSDIADECCVEGGGRYEFPKAVVKE